MKAVQRSERPSTDPKTADRLKMKKFDKLKYLEYLGLIERRFNYTTERFESSWRLRLKYYAILLLKVTFCLKIFASRFFEQTDPVQLLIGSPYTYFGEGIRRFITLAAFIVLSWVICLNVIFNHLNTRRDYHLYRRWMRLTLEIPAKKEDDYKTVGLSTEMNKKFWKAVEVFNYNWNLAVNALIFGFSLSVAVLLFLIPYQVPIDFSYFLFQTIGIIHVCLTFYTFLNPALGLALFNIQVIRFFSKKFGFILKRVERLNATQASQINNRKLTKLICHYYTLNFELTEMNAFFSAFVGISLIHSGSFIVIVSRSNDLSRYLI